MLDEISRAIREKRYVRFQPAPEEIDSIDSKAEGKINIGKAFRDLGREQSKENIN